MSKGVKSLVAVGAAIAIPFAAPAIASTIGLSSTLGGVFASTMAGEIAGSALVGSVLGAASAKMTGGSATQGALFGALGGGMGGYTSAANAANAAAAAPAAQAAAPAAQAVTPAATGAATTAPSAGIMDNIGEFFSNPTAVAADSSTASWLGTTPGGGPLPGAVVDAGAAANVPPGAVVDTAPKVPTGAGTAASQKAGLMDGINWRNASVQLGTSMAGAMMPTDKTQEQLAAQQQAALEEQARQNAELYQQKVNAANMLLEQSASYDPAYAAQQAANRTQIASSAATQRSTRGLSGTQLAAARRAADLGTARNVATGYDTGYSSGLANQQSTIKAGLSAMPTGYPTTDYSSLSNMYATAADRTAKEQEQVGAALFSSLYGQNKTQTA